jgi:hypothetical protein
MNLRRKYTSYQSVELATNYDYALNMKTKNTVLLLSSVALLCAGAASAQFYKSVDAEGNIVYSDTPTPGAEKLNPPPISTVEGMPKPEKTTEPEAKPGEEGGEEAGKKPPTRYSKFSITSPSNEATIWDNTGALPLALALEPPLDTENGHSVYVYVDGKAVVRKSQSLVQQLSGIDRGAHKVRAEIRDENRKTLKRTQNITVHMKRASAL